MLPDTDASNGGTGYFVLRRERGPKTQLRIVASDIGEWEHVSVSTKTRCPTWDEMCDIKALFWEDEETVMQLHPPKSQHISNMPFCLHLWRPKALEIPLPPSIMVGIKSLGELNKDSAVLAQAILRRQLTEE
jgi:hypothetical protein